MVLIAVTFEDDLSAIDRATVDFLYLVDTRLVGNPHSFMHIFAVLGHRGKVDLINIHTALNAFDILFAVEVTFFVIPILCLVDAIIDVLDLIRIQVGVVLESSDLEEVSRLVGCVLCSCPCLHCNLNHSVSAYQSNSHFYTPFKCGVLFD